MSQTQDTSIVDSLLLNAEAEQNAIGLALKNRDHLKAICSELDPDCFVLGENKTLFSILSELNMKNTAADVHTVYQIAKSKGSSITISKLNLWKLLATDESLGQTIDTLNEYRIHRQGYKAIQQATDPLLDMLEDGKAILSSLSSTMESIISSRGKMEFKESYHDMMVDITNRMNGIGTVAIKTPLRSLNEALAGGFEPGTLAVVGAKPGAGKTALTMWLLKSWHDMGISAGFVSLEMRPEQIMRREIAMETGIFYSRLKDGKINQYDLQQVGRAIFKLEESSFHRVSAGHCDIHKLRNMITDMHYKHGCKVIVIDYLQRMTFQGKENRSALIGEVVKSIKALAVQYGIAILLLSQLSRETDKESNKEPKVHHLRDSGEIEEAADYILLLHRPDMYRTEEEPKDNMLFIHIDKNRDGANYQRIAIAANMGTNTFAEASYVNQLTQNEATQPY